MNVKKHKVSINKKNFSQGERSDEEKESITYSNIEVKSEESVESLIKRLKKFSEKNDEKDDDGKREQASVEFMCYPRLVNKELVFMKKKKRVFKINLKRLAYQNFGFKVILYKKNKDNGENQLIMELNGSDENTQNLIKIIKKSNWNKARSFPLASKFDSKEGDSPFTDKSKPLNLRGFLNLFIIYSLINFARIGIEHFINSKHYFKEKWSILFPDFSLIELLIVLANYIITIILTYLIQYWTFQKKLSNGLANWMMLVFLSFYFFLSSYLVFVFNFSIFVNCFINGMNVTVLLKAISFSHVSHSIRVILEKMESNPNKILVYEELFQENQISKNNFLIVLKNKDSPTKMISIHHSLYYLFIPTFNFQLRYAKKAKINKFLLLKRIIETICLWFSFFSMVAYFVVPMIEESDSIFIKETTIFEKFTYFIRLSLTCTFSWILMFVAVFYGYCEAISELFKLADRRFYLDWWNSLNISQYWRLWNLPIHNFFLCHVSNPLTSLGLNRHIINTLVFVMSAIFHEYLISLALKRFYTWTLITFSLQYFYILFETAFMKFFKLENSIFGNYIFWAMLCFYGQPTLILQYYFYVKYGQNFTLWVL
jgi:hypothetical protein